MKKIKSLFAALFCICIIVSGFSGCSPISLEGKWRATVSLTQMINSQLNSSDNEDVGEYAGEFSQELTIDLIYSFDENNSYTISVDEEKFKSDCDVYIESYIDYLVEVIYKYSQASDISKDNLDKYYQDEIGASLKESLKDELALDKLCDEIAADFTRDTRQPASVRSGKLYITDDNGDRQSYEAFTADGDTITITGHYDMLDNELEDEDNIYPIVLTKESSA